MTTSTPVGVRWVSALPGDGYGDAALQYIAALEALGVPLTWTPIAWSGSKRTVAHDYRGPMAHLAHRQIEHDVIVLHMPVNGARDWLESSWDGRTVSVTTWETDRPPAGWTAMADTFDAVVVPSAFNRDALLAEGCRAPVHAVPHVVLPDPRVPPARYPDIGDRFVFYTIGTWTTRKAMADTVSAFLDAFTARDDVALVVKTTPWNQQSVARGSRAGSSRSVRRGGRPRPG